MTDQVKVEKTPEKITYHDGSRLARDLGEHEEPREILRAMGYTISEMWQNRRLARCCGSALAGRYMPEIRRMTAENRWNDAKRTDAKLLCAACPQSTEALRETVPEGYRYEDLFVLWTGICRQRGNHGKGAEHAVPAGN